MNLSDITVEELLGMSGIGQTKRGRQKMASDIAIKGIHTAQDFADDIRVNERGHYTCSIYGWGPARLESVIPILKKLGANIPKAEADVAFRIHYSEAATRRIIIRTKSLLRRWETYAIQKGYKIE